MKPDYRVIIFMSPIFMCQRSWLHCWYHYAYFIFASSSFPFFILSFFLYVNTFIIKAFTHSIAPSLHHNTHINILHPLNLPTFHHSLCSHTKIYLSIEITAPLFFCTLLTSLPHILSNFIGCPLTLYIIFSGVQYDSSSLHYCFIESEYLNFQLINIHFYAVIINCIKLFS